MNSITDVFGVLVRNGLLGFSYFAIVYFILVNIASFLMLALSFRKIVRYLRREHFSDFRDIAQSEFSLPISILAPAYNEQETIVESVNSLLKLNYSTMEVVVINDGSNDGTLKKMIGEFSLRKIRRVSVDEVRTKPVRNIYVSKRPELKNLIVVDKINGGKADALNAGINVSQYPLICAIDADCIMEEDALLKVAKPFLEDETVVGVGGIVRIANGCEVEHGRVKTVHLSRRRLPVFQAVEYLRAFLSGRIAWSAINGLLIISGAFGLFRKDIVLACGGYKHDTVGEDMELVTRIHHYMFDHHRPARIVFIPDPVCWTEVPDSIEGLGGQRNRWHRGLIDTLSIHRSMFFKPRYGIIGMFSIPYYFMFELVGPLIESLGYIVVLISALFGLVDFQMLVLFFLVAIVYGMLFSVGAVLLEEISFHRYPRAGDLLRLMGYAVWENFGYRQLTLIWRMKGLIDHFRGVKTWGVTRKAGFATSF